MDTMSTSNYINGGQGCTREQAEAGCLAMRAVVPSSWSVQVRPGSGPTSNPTCYKVVAQAAEGGLNIVCHGGTGRYFVHGVAGDVAVMKTEGFRIVGYETAREAFDALVLVVTRITTLARMQYASLEQ